MTAEKLEHQDEDGKTIHPKDRRVNYAALVSLKFLRHYAGFNPGEIGGMTLIKACAAVEAGLAELNEEAPNYKDSEEKVQAYLHQKAAKKEKKAAQNKQQKTEENTQTDTDDEDEVKPRIRRRVRRTKDS